MAMEQDRPAPVMNVLNRASEETAVPAEQIQIVDVEQVDWPDHALGVPEPGRLYAQQIVPGFRVHVRAGGWEMVYHTDMERRVIRAS